MNEQNVVSFQHAQDALNSYPVRVSGIQPVP